MAWARDLHSHRGGLSGTLTIGNLVQSSSHSALSRESELVTAIRRLISKASDVAAEYKQYRGEARRPRRIHLGHSRQLRCQLCLRSTNNHPRRRAATGWSCIQEFIKWVSAASEAHPVNITSSHRHSEWAYSSATRQKSHVAGAQALEGASLWRV